MVVQNISANGKETDLTFTIKSDDLNKARRTIIENKKIDEIKQTLKEKELNEDSING